jgi:hypothetical protein
MTIDERLEYITALQQSHDEQIGKLIEQNAILERNVLQFAERTDRTLKVLTERTIQAMDAINRLAHIAENHDNRISGLEEQ